jgi:hypothetical protein
MTRWCVLRVPGAVNDHRIEELFQLNCKDLKMEVIYYSPELQHRYKMLHGATTQKTNV